MHEHTDVPKGTDPVNRVGRLARGQIKRTREGGRGLATAALIIGYLQVAAIVAVVGVAAVLVAHGAQ
jgi:hypothetical protein